MKKPCEFCDFEQFQEPDIVDNLSVTCEIYPSNMIAFSVTGLDSEEHEVNLEYSVPMNYCPNCGRKLV